MRTALLRWTMLCATAITIGGSFAQDAYIENATVARYIKADQNYTLSMKIMNNGPGYVTSFSVRWRLDGGTWHNGTTVNITPPGLGSGGYYMAHTHVTPLNAAQGQHTVELNVVVSGDLDQTNNTVTIPFTAITAYADKVVLLEARTETWCPNCPVSNDETNELMLVPEYAVAKFHLSDEFDFPDGNVYYGQYNVTYTPAGIVDMGDYDTYAVNSQWPGWGDAMEGRAQGVSPLQLVMASSLDWTTRELTVTLDANFTFPVTGGEFKMNIYVMENNVPGSQENAPSGYVHNRLMRAMMGGASGTTGVIPASPVVGTSYSHTYTWTVPAGIKLGDLKLIGLVEQDLGTAGRGCINCVKSSASPVGITEQTLEADRLVVYPNPFEQDLAVVITGLWGKARAELLSVDGRQVESRTVILNGSAPTRLDMGDNIRPGTYVLRMITEKGTIERNVVKVD